MPLPDKDKPKDFNGAIGEFELRRDVDVRKADSFQAGHIVDAQNIEGDELLAKPDSIKAKKTALLVCDNGNRSGEIAAQLRKDGRENVFSLQGGLNAWQQENLPVVQD